MTSFSEVDMSVTWLQIPELESRISSHCRWHIFTTKPSSSQLDLCLIALCFSGSTWILWRSKVWSAFVDHWLVMRLASANLKGHKRSDITNLTCFFLLIHSVISLFLLVGDTEPKLCITLLHLLHSRMNISAPSRRTLTFTDLRWSLETSNLIKCLTTGPSCTGIVNNYGPGSRVRPEAFSSEDYNSHSFILKWGNQVRSTYHLVWWRVIWLPAIMFEW